MWLSLAYLIIFPIYQSLIFWKNQDIRQNLSRLIVLTRLPLKPFTAKSNPILNMDPDLFSYPYDNYRQFEEIIVNAKAKHLAPKTVRFKKHKHKLSQWMTSGILNSIKFRDKLFLKLKTLNSTSELHDSINANLKSYNKTLKELIRLAKIRYYSNQFDKNKSNIRHTWSTI